MDAAPVGVAAALDGDAVVAGVSSCLARDSSVPKVLLTLDDNDLFYPIPQAAIDVNPNLTQNPGY